MTIGTYEAKTHLAALLERVSRGEEITITRHGVPIAKLVPCTPTVPAPKDARTAIESIKRLRAKIALGGLSIREMIEEGRR